MTKFFGCALIALVVLQVQISCSFSIDSTSENKLVEVLKAINNITFQIETYADNFFTEKLKNETGIKEWSANIQAELATNLTKVVFAGYEWVKQIMVETGASGINLEVLNCISNEEDNILATIESAFTNNGWCNNRLAANLTHALKTTSSALLEINSQIKADLETLDKCDTIEIICLTTYANKVISLLKEGLNGGALGTGLKESLAIYKIMFPQDVPRCAKEVLLPQLQEGLSKSAQNIIVCLQA